MYGFIKLHRYSKNAEEMLRRRPTAFLLLFLIAQRARRTIDSNFDNLQIGEAKIGDYESYGATEQIYRSDKIFLEKFNFATFRGTDKGTIAKLIDTSIFDINVDQPNDLINEQLTDSQRATNEQLTTNKNIKKKKKINKFIKPILKEVEDYCNERKNNINPETFYNYYESTGWMRGKTPMKDWKATIRTWESNNSDKNKGLSVKPEPGKYSNIKKTVIDNQNE